MTIAVQLENYLDKTLHSKVALHDWSKASQLPTYLSRRYDYYAGKVIGQKSLFAIDRGKFGATPADIEKHMVQMANKFDGLVIYVASGMNSNRRSRFISNGVPFIVPGNQLYIPQLALDLREHFRSRLHEPSGQLSPAAQLLFFYCILFDGDLESDRRNRTPSRLAKSLYYSAMSVGRAFDELVSANLAHVEISGRAKQIYLASNPRLLVEQARELLRTPVRSIQFAQTRLTVPPMKLGGEAALANITGLAPPHLPVYAVHSDDWTLLAQSKDLLIVDDPDQADAKIELWYYRPDILSEYVTVDSLSLYAQFWDHPDERVAKAAEEALDHIVW
jgi:hypothetical protein